MDDMMSRIGAVLGDEESMAQLRELAEMLRGGMAENGENGENTCDEGNATDASESADSGFDPEMLMRLMSAMSALNGSDRNTELLLALRPHLRAEKQLRLDKALKMLRMLAVFEAAKQAELF